VEKRDYRGRTLFHIQSTKKPGKNICLTPGKRRREKYRTEGESPTRGKESPCQVEKIPNDPKKDRGVTLIKPMPGFCDLAIWLRTKEGETKD